MEEYKIEQNKESEIDIRRLLEALLNRIWLVVMTSVVGAVVTLAVTALFVTPQYQSSAMFYVNNSSLSVGDASLTISSGDLVTSRNLVNSYIVILNTRESLEDVIDYAGVDRSYAEVKKMLSAQAVDETEIFRVTVTCDDPNEAEKIANAIAYILPKRISSIIEGTSAKVVSSAVVAATPSSPSYTKNVAIGFLLGFAMSAGAVVLMELFDITIRTEEDIVQSCKHPVLAAVPDMAAPGKGGYDYSYDRSKKKTGKKGAAVQGKEPVLIGANISFAAAEAYKLLRTKLQFSFADENESHVIGVSSALSGEGKSLSAVNVAYSLSQLGKKVILIDCDMRRPTLAEKLKINKKPGLSSYLTGQSSIEGLIQFCNIPRDERAFHVISAGQNPPNPIELLSSPKMEKMIRALRKLFDYIILDLPPVSEVSDAMAVAKQTDGILLVVRQNYCDRQVLSETVRQFEFVDAKILGVVYNCTSDGSGRGYYKKYYRKYGKKYYGRKYYGRKYYGQKYYGRSYSYSNPVSPYQAAADKVAQEQERSK